MTSAVHRIVAMCFALFALTVSACADEAKSPAGEKLELIAGEGVASDGAYMAGLSLTMAEGWHTYWRHPGDSGIAPQFDWTGSRNLRSVEVLWPVPERFDAPDDVTYGYAAHVIWPLRVVPVDPMLPVEIKLRMYYGVCLDICVPVDAQLGLTLPEGGRGDETSAINTFLDRVPVAPENSDDVTVSLVNGALHITLKALTDAPVVIVEGPKNIWFGASRAKRAGNDITYEVPIENNSGATLVGAEVRLTFAGPSTALEVTRKLK